MSSGLKIVWLVPVLLCLLITFSGPVRADDTIQIQMRGLLETAGAVPDAIIDPPCSPADEIGFLEILHRFWMERILGNRIIYSTALGKACFANQRVIAEAVEVYNRDSETPMHVLSDTDVTDPTGLLVSGKYLLCPVNRPEIDCVYHSYGNLTGNGIVYCSQHGAVTDYRKTLLKITGIKPKSLQGQNEIQWALVGLFILISAGILVVILIRRFRRESGKLQN